MKGIEAKAFESRKARKKRENTDKSKSESRFTGYYGYYGYYLNHRFTLMNTDYTEKQKQRRIPLSPPYK